MWCDGGDLGNAQGQDEDDFAGHWRFAVETKASTIDNDVNRHVKRNANIMIM